MTAPVLPGAEPASFSGDATGVLVVHGFTGSPQSMRGIAERLAADGRTVEMPLLPGHGTSVEDMIPTRFADWYAAAEEALAELATRTERQVVVGLSMGGTVVTTLAADHDVAGLVAINAAIDPPAAELVTAVTAMIDAGEQTMPAIGGDIAKEGATELAYDAAPLAALVSLVEHGIGLVGRLADITCPTLIVTSRQDHVVDPASSDTLAAGVAGPVERLFLDDSFHVVTLDLDAPAVEDAISRFVSLVAG